MRTLNEIIKDLSGKIEFVFNLGNEFGGTETERAEELFTLGDLLEELKTHQNDK